MAADEVTTQQHDEVIMRLFLGAMSRPESEQEQFLREVCPDDGALLAEVQRRLHWERRLNGFLLTPVTPRDRMDHPFAIGETVLGRFQILRIAGEGGMGVVYEVLDEKLGHKIALKCPRFEFRRRLSPEAMRSLRVTHPNVCRVFEIHTAETSIGEVDFLTMEFLEGKTIASRLKAAPARWLDQAEGLAVAQQIAGGLSAIHAQGVVHRDLKPSNVMLSTDVAGQPRAVIMDFGISQASDVLSSLKGGTPDYLAPEVWQGAAASPQSDIYSLGVLLYEMASGHKPFPPEIDWNDRANILPQTPRTREPLRSIILRCLQPDPLKRFQTASQVERALKGGSRRWMLGGLASATAAGLSAVALRGTYWPTSKVQLVVLPLAAEGAAADTSLIRGFMHDVSYRLKTLRGSRRSLTVYSPLESATENVTTAAAAKSFFGATHVLTTAVQQTGPTWSLTVELHDIDRNQVVLRIDRSFREPKMAGVLFALQSDIVRRTTQELVMQPQPRAEALNRSTYADYLRGIYFARVDYENAAKAIPYFEKVITSAPNSALGYAGLAEALFGVRNATGNKALEGRAQDALAKAEQLEPDLAPVHLMAGRLNLAAEWYERAVADLQRAAELDPNDAQAYISMGYALYFLNRFPEAEAAFAAACRAQPHYYKPFLETGLFHYERGNFPKAEVAWREAVRLNPKHSRARLNLATLYLYSGRLAEASEHTQESLKLRKSADGFHLLAALQEQRASDTEAVASYQTAIQLSPEPYKIWADLGAIYRRLGRERDAVRAFESGLSQSERARTILAREAEPVAWCAFYLANLGKTEQARKLAQEALAIAGGMPKARARKRLVYLYGLLNDFDAALGLLDGASPGLIQELEHSPDLSPALRRDPRFVRLTR